MAVASSWNSPLVGGVKIARPLTSSASVCPFTRSARLATAEKASASTLMATGCPGTAGKLGVSESVTLGPAGAAVTRSAAPCSTGVLPSLAVKITR